MVLSPSCDVSGTGAFRPAGHASQRFPGPKPIGIAPGRAFQDVASLDHRANPLHPLGSTGSPMERWLVDGKRFTVRSEIDKEPARCDRRAPTPSGRHLLVTTGSTTRITRQLSS